MRLVQARVQNFKNIDDSGWVDVGGVTCLVGKNESGKTAFLQALEKIKPISGISGNLDMTMDYPRKARNRYKRTHENDPAVAIETVFELTDEDVAELEEEFGKGVFSSRKVRVSKKYDNKRSFGWSHDEKKIVRHLVNSADVPAPMAKELRDAGSVEALTGQLARLADSEASPLLAQIQAWPEADLNKAIIARLDDLLPEFFYFDEYSLMPGRISVPHLRARRDRGDLEEGDRTFLALLDFVGADLNEFDNPANYERLKAELEAASNQITDELFEFWSQNDQLAVEFDVSETDPHAMPPLNEGTNLHVRIRNDRHRVTVPFDQRSRGFVWFFSFLAYFSELERDEDADLILLLDEPGLNLHAKAQEDFLRLIEDRLAPTYQVFYTTHSPFMVDPKKLDRVRTVEDVDHKGTKISDEVFRAGRDTVFPLQAALGYELAQTLFVGPDNLVVEGPADYVYLTVMSDHLASLGRGHLDERWTIVPVGGLEKIPTFVALLGAKLNVAVLMDGSSGGSQRIDSLIERGVIGSKKVIPLTAIGGEGS